MHSETKNTRAGKPRRIVLLRSPQFKMRSIFQRTSDAGVCLVLVFVLLYWSIRFGIAMTAVEVVGAVAQTVCELTLMGLAEEQRTRNP